MAGLFIAPPLATIGHAQVVAQLCDHTVTVSTKGIFRLQREQIFLEIVTKYKNKILLSLYNIQ